MQYAIRIPPPCPEFTPDVSSLAFLSGAIRNTRQPSSVLRHLHLSRTLYKSTLFMQNKPNFRKAKMNVSIFSTKAYKNKHNWTLSENKPKTNPIKPNFRNAQMSANAFSQKDYRKNDAFAVQKNKPNSNPMSVKPKMSANAFSQKDYENETHLQAPKKQTQFKPNVRKAQNERKRFFTKGL